MKKGIFIALLWIAAAVIAFAADRILPGPVGKGTVLLPNGWKIAPAGRHLPLDDLPLEMIESPDGNYLIVTNDGYSKPVLDVVDLRRFYVLDRASVVNAWLGLAWSPDGKKLYSSTGGSGGISTFGFESGKLKLLDSFPITSPVKGSFIGGLTVSPDGKRIYAVHILGNTLTMLNSSDGKTLQTAPLDAEPYTSLISPDGRSLYVSLWGGRRVVEFDAENIKVRRAFEVGEHPSAMVLAPDSRRLFVACASTNSVWILNLQKATADEQISVALYPQAPLGSTPSALSLSSDGKQLLVTNSDNNAVAVIDVSRPGNGKVLGFIPTGWYPTAARFSRDNKRIFVLSGKGLTSTANPRGADEPNYIAEMLLGTLSVLDRPDATALTAYTKTVYDVTPYKDAFRLSPPAAPQHSVIPRRVGDLSPVKHVFYIIRENRTYDQIFGDLPQGNGDPNLCLFGEQTTLNAHALAREFVLLDNFYVDAEVSADGHAFSTAAYANDFVEKTWPMNYAGRGGAYLSEGGGAMRNGYGNIAAPAGGYIWDAARKKKITLRSYGEFAHWKSGDEEDTPHGTEVVSGVPGLEGVLNLEYPAWDLKIPDSRRVDIWLKEFQKFVKDGTLPQLSIFHLPSDHTAGTRPGSPTPRAMVAENDVALGRMVESISTSPFWKDSAIFVLEDDAQDGPDHVDAHRSVAFVISPYTRRKAVDSTMYTTSGMLRTIELILGLEPMSQYDASAAPMYSVFQNIPDLTPYHHQEAKISIQEKNASSAFGAKESMAMNLEDPDRIPMRLMNEILWKSVMGASSPMPPPVRAAFIHTK